MSVRAVSYHKFNEASRLSRIVEELKSGITVALVSDAGTPGISDPGARLVAAARDAGIDVEAIPGPSAPAAALSVAGIEAAGYVFAGYPPPKSAARRRFFRSLAAAEEARAAADPSATPWPLVLFEAPHRIEACLSDLEAELGDRSIVAIREMTKIHEETLRGTVSSVAAALRERQRRGEFTLVVTGALGFLKRSVERSMPENRSELRAAYDEIVRAGTDRREALRRLARERGLTRNELYRELAAAGGDPSPDDDGAEDATGG